MLSNNYGYACINMGLSNAKPRIYTGRTMIKKTFKSKGIAYASFLGLKNAKDLIEIINWNRKNGINFFRITSDLVPWSSEFNLCEMTNYSEFKETLLLAGKIIKESNMRITAHPGPFNILNSPNKNVVKNCIKDLSTHGEIFDLMDLSRTTFNKINIHIGGSYNDKILSMKRFCKNFNLLPESVKSRLTVENDDRQSLYSVKDLYDGIFKVIGIPIVFDYHHHRFCDGGLTEEAAVTLASQTWGDIKQVVHYSESRNLEYDNESIRPQAHSDYVYNYINTYELNLDIMIEAKHKELAVMKYLKIHNLE